MGRFDSIIQQDTNVEMRDRIESERGGPAVITPAKTLRGTVPVERRSEPAPRPRRATPENRANQATHIQQPTLIDQLMDATAAAEAFKEVAAKPAANVARSANEAMLQGAPLAPEVNTTSEVPIAPSPVATPAPEPTVGIVNNAVIGNTTGTAIQSTPGPEITEELDKPEPPKENMQMELPLDIEPAPVASPEDVEDAKAAKLDSDISAFSLISKSEPQIGMKTYASSRPPLRDRPYASKKHQSDGAKLYGYNGPGQGVSEVLIADEALSFEEASFGSKLFIEAYRNPGSLLREIVQGDFNQNRMDTDEDYLEQELIKFFANNDIELLMTKNPVPNEGSAHKRIIRVHAGTGVRIHPVTGKIFNADYDGDTASVSFNREYAKGAKDAVDLLIDTEGSFGVDRDFFYLLPWGTNKRDVYKQLDKLLADEGLSNIPKSIMGRLADAVVLASSGNPKTEERGFYLLLHTVRALGDMTAKKNPLQAAKIMGVTLRAIYRYNGDIRKSKLMIFPETTFDFNGEVLTGRTDFSSEYPWDDSRVHAGFAANMNDFKALFNTPVRAVAGKNLHYRIDAALAKEIKQRHIFGRHNFDLIEEADGTFLIDASDVHTMAVDLVTQQMSAVTDFKEVSNNISAMMSELIIGEVGKPDLADFEGWMEGFITAYNRAASIINAAALQINLDNTVSESSKFRKLKVLDDADVVKNWDDSAAEFVKVYGRFTLKHLFGDYAAGFEDTTLGDFAVSNRSKQFNKSMKGKDFGNPKQYLWLLADRRTSYAAKYNSSLMEFLEKKMFTNGKGEFGTATNWLQDRVKKAQDNPAFDYELLAIIDAFNLLGPDMFYYFGLDNVASFRTTDLGRKFIAAKNADQMAGVLYEAVGRYRWEPIQRIQEKLRESEGDPIALAKYELELDNAFKSLSSASDTWAAIVYDYVHGGTAISDILLNDELGKADKDELLNQLQKSTPNGWVSQQDWQIASELMANPRGLYSSSRHLSDFGHNTVLKNLNKASDKIDAYVKSNHEAISKQVKYARSAVGNDVVKYFQAVAKNPGILSRINVDMYVDAVLATMETDFNFSEKASQTKIINAFFSALSRFTNGGLFSEFKVGDSFFMQRIHEDDLLDWNIGIAKIITDPDFSITVFNDSNPIGAVVNQVSIFGHKNPTAEEIWDFLERNPRAAMALRVGTSIGSEKGKAYQIATSTLKNSMLDVISSNTDNDPLYDQAYDMLIQHPYFAAIVSLSIKQQGRKRMQLRKEGKDAIERAIQTMRLLATADNPLLAAEEFVDGILAGHQMGIPNPSTYGDTFADYETSDMFGLYGPGQILEHVTENLGKYAQMLKDAGLADANVDPSSIMTLELKDPATTRSYFNAVQLFSGAKTETDTAINAGASLDNAALIYLAGRVDAVPCNAPEPEGIPVEDFRSNWENPEYHRHQARTHSGGWIPVKASTIDRIIEEANHNDGMVYIESTECHNLTVPCIRHGMADMSTSTKLGRQTTALSRMMTTLRTWASEMLNLKVKTKGDDGTDLIVKRNVFAEDWSKHEEKIHNAYTTALLVEGAQEIDALNAARLALAEIMEAKWGKADESNPDAMEYDAMSLDDYMNIAHYLVRPNLTSGIVVLSISQVNAAVRGAIVQAHLDNPGKKFSYAELAGIARGALEFFETIDPTAQAIDVDGIFAKLKVNRQGKYRNAVPSQRQSSWEANMSLLQEIIRDNPDANMMTHSEIQKTVETFNVNYPAVVNSNPKFLGTTNEKTGEVDTKYAYNFLGVITADAIKVNKVPGPRTMWVLSAHATEPVVKAALAEAYKLGVTVLLPSRPNEKMERALENATFVTANGESNFKMQLVEQDDGSYLLPMFDIRLNGENTELREGAFNTGTTRIPPEQFLTIVESDFFDLGDAEALTNIETAGRARPTKSGEYRTGVSAMFANVLEAVKMSQTKLEMNVSLATKEEIERDIIKGKNLSIDTGQLDSPRVTQEMRRDIQTYINEYSQTDENGVLLSSKPNRVIGWAKAELVDSTGQVKNTYYHPIKAYPTDNQSGAPSSFDIKEYRFDEDSQSFVMSWEHKGSLIGQLFKFFESGYAANKFMVRDRYMDIARFLDGTLVDMVVSTKSTVSRRGPIQRIQSMSTLLTKARLEPWGYNLAELDGTFPNDPELKEGLLAGTLQLGDWIQRMADGPIEFYANDPARNAFANYVTQACINGGNNPSVFFASKHNGIATNLHFNYQTVMASSNTYQNGLMTFLNDMLPNYVPASMSDEDPNTFFNNKLQLLMPVTHPRTGETGYERVYAYVGRHFMDEHYTGFSMSGSAIMEKSLPALNTLGFGGKILSDSDVEAYNHWGNLNPRSSMNAVTSGYDLEMDGD